MQTLMNIKKAWLLLLMLTGTTCCSAQFGATQSFDGVNQSAVTPPGMMNGATVFTIEFWIKTTENRSNGTYWQRPTLIGEASSGNASGDFGITTNNGYIGIWSGLNNGGDNDFLSTTTQINNNQWHHIAAVNDGANIKLYADGVLQGSIASGLALITAGAPLTLSAASLDFGFSGNIGNCNFFHQGIMDEVRFSNNIRYTGNFTVPSSAFTPDANTVALYHLDGCVNSLIPDAGSNANNASPRNLTGSCAFVFPPVPNIPAVAAPSAVSKAEYFFDTDPGFGNGTTISVAAANDININPSINISALSNGAHRLSVRTRDAAGHWSLTNSQVFVIVAPTPVIPASAASAQIVKAEYFYDTDPGFGNGMNIPITAAFDVTNTFAANLNGLGNGVHRVYLRTKDAKGGWSITNVAVFNIVQAAPSIPSNPSVTNIVKAEYFTDTDPGFGNGTDIPLTAGTDVTLSSVFINLTGLSNGVHRVYVRTKDVKGSWSITNFNVFSIVAASVIIPPNPVPGNITKVEYFFDHDPGFGHATQISVTPTTDLSAFSFVADISTLNDSMHTLYIRTYDGWGITNTKTFLKGALVPLNWLSFNAKAAADSVLLDWITGNQVNADHFDVERSADGRSFKKIGAVAANNAVSTPGYHFTDNDPLDGISYYRIKAVDHNGQFNYSVIIAVRFGKPETVTLYPNPASDVLHILFAKQQQKNTVATIINSSGQTVLQTDISGLQSKQINVAAFANGIYELRISGTATVTQKIVIRH